MNTVAIRECFKVNVSLLLYIILTGFPEVGNFDLRTTALTIFFMREHNRIARALHHMER